MKLVAGLSFVIILLGSVCGVLYYQISDLENQNDVLLGQVCEYQSHVDELEVQIDALESQIDVLQNSGLENQTDFSNQSDVSESENQTLANIVDVVFINSTAVRVTVENYGTNDADRLYVSVRYNSSFSHPSVAHLDLLAAGERQAVNCGTGYGIKGENAELIVTLKLDGTELNDKELDEVRINP